jgi:hypothetical protein
MARMDFIQEAFWASLLWKHKLRLAGDVQNWKALFSCSPLICQMIWGTLVEQCLKPPKAQTVHLLRILHILKLFG